MLGRENDIVEPLEVDSPGTNTDERDDLEELSEGLVVTDIP